jgi:hypothetical protein
MSFFASEKDLRKAPKKQTRPTRKTSSTSSTGKSDGDISNTRIGAQSTNVIVNNDSVDIVTQAKVEREKREGNRVQNSKVVKIQSWFRGRQGSIVHLGSLKATFLSKLNDIEKVNTLLAQKNIPHVVPPVDVCLLMLRQWVFINTYSRQGCSHLRKSFCSLVLCPTFSQLDIAKNVMILVHRNYPTYSILVNLLRTLLDSKQPCDLECSKCVHLLLGAGVPYKMKYAAELDLAFHSFRTRVFNKDNQLAFGLIRKVLTYSTRFLHLIKGDTDPYALRQTKKDHRSGMKDHGHFADLLLNTCMFLVFAVSTPQALASTSSSMSSFGSSNKGSSSHSLSN